MRFPEAVDYLLAYHGRSRDSPDRNQPVPRPKPPPPKEKPPFVLPPANPDQRRVFAYLRGRCVSAQVIRAFMDAGLLYEDAQYHNSMFLGYSELLNALDTGSTTKITINNKRLNRQNFEQEILIPRQEDFLDGYRAEYNSMLMDKVTDSSNSVVQERYITLSVHRKNVEEARTFFDRVTADVTTRLSHLDAHSEELDAVERLRVLHDFYRTGEESEYRLDLRDLMGKGHSFKDAICPDSLEFKKDHFIMGNKFGRVLFLKEYASYIKDSMINELTALNRTMMLSIDVIPVPTDEAVREMQNRLLGVETNVTNWQRRQNNNNNFSAVVPYDLEQQRKETRPGLGLPLGDAQGGVGRRKPQHWNRAALWAGLLWLRRLGILQYFWRDLRHRPRRRRAYAAHLLYAHHLG